MNKALYVMIGGFLGAGKTTAVLRIAERLRGEGKRVGLITNDQSFGLVDTAMLGSHGFDVEEITGGCFCCRFQSLLEASQRLSRAARPDVFLAEPVGSCTDLRASVSYPLRRIYGDDFEVAPFSVMLDPVRAERVLGLASGRSFAPKVLYVYGKQLEEADLILINKSDLLSEARLARLREALKSRYPRAHVLAASARHGDGLVEWFDQILSGAAGSWNAPELDYEIYAEGEALLGWLNATVTLESAAGFDGNDFVRGLASRLQASLGEFEIAHLKMTLSPGEEGPDLAVLNLVRSDGAAEMSHQLGAPLHRGELIINLRAEADPEQLWAAGRAAIQQAALQHNVGWRVLHHEHFRPAKPSPTYRMAAVE